MSAKKSNPIQSKPVKWTLWPVLLAVIGLLLLVAGLFWAFGRSKEPTNVEVRGKSSLKVDQEKIDLGDIKLGEWVDVTFTVTNVGDQILRFTKKPYIQVAEGC